MKKRQTAVEILYKFLYEMESFGGFDPYHYNQEDVFNKAKEIEKKQNGETWDAALEQYNKRGKNYIRAWEDFEEYYEIFEK